MQILPYLAYVLILFEPAVCIRLRARLLCIQRRDPWEAQEVGVGGVVGLVEETGLEDEGGREALVLLVGEKGLPAIEVTRSNIDSCMPAQH